MRAIAGNTWRCARPSLAATFSGWVLMLGALAGSSSAATIDAGPFFPVEGPRLAGEELVWVPAYRTDRFEVKRGSLSGGSTRTIFESRATRDYGVVLNALVASPTQVLLQQALPDAFDEREVVRIGNDGQIEYVGKGCECFRRQIDLSGDIGIFNGSAPGATIRDFGAVGSEPEIVEPVSGSMRVAGRYAAWEHAGDIVVYDRETSSEAYRLEGIWPKYEDDRDLDVQSDGKVGFYFQDDVGGRRRSRLAWASPAEPFVHRLPVRDEGSYTIRMHGDRIVFVRDDGHKLKGGQGRVTSFGELGQVGLTGSHQTLVRPVESEPFEDHFDFDGTRVAWLDRSCRAAKLRSATLQELMAAPRLRSKRHGRPCRLRLVRPAGRGSYPDYLRLPLNCAGFRAGCVTTATALRTLRAYRLGGRRVPKGTRVDAGRGDRGRGEKTEVELTTLGQRLLGRPGHIRLGARTIIGDHLVAERRRGRITVR